MGFRWMCGYLLGIDSRSDECDYAALLLHVQAWKNVSALFSIKRMRLNSNDSHQSMSSESVIDDATATPNLAYIYTCSLTMQSILGCFILSNCLDISILESRDFFHF